MKAIPATTAEWMRWVGFASFGLSFIWGYYAFWYALQVAFLSFVELVNRGNLGGGLMGATLVIGWAADFSVVVRLPRMAAVLAMFAPWVLYLGMMLLWSNPGTSFLHFDSWVVTYWPFYPWSIGIGLVNFSRWLEPAPKDFARTPWNGF